MKRGGVAFDSWEREQCEEVPLWGEKTAWAKAWRGKVEELRIILRLDPRKAGLKDKLGRIPLVWASMHGYLEVSQRLREEPRVRT